VVLATFMEVLDVSIANVALPHIAGSLAAGTDESTWVLTSYLVSNAIILPMSGWFSQMLGRKRFYLACVVLFTLSSAACGMTPSLAWLVFFRVLQGLGGGGLQPSSQAIIADTFEPRRRGMAFAVYGMAVVTAPAIGPTLGGWITDNLDWRWIFWINIPVGVVSLLLSSRFVEDPPHLSGRQRRNSIDYVGFALVALGLGTLQVVLDKGQRQEWLESRFIVTFSAISACSLLAAVWWELRHRDPIVDLRLLRERNFAAANLLMFALGFVLLGSTVLLPQMLQLLLGYTATRAGMALSPGGLVIMLLLPFVGMALSRGVQPKWLIIVGLCISALGLLRMSHFNLQITFTDAATARIVQACGMAMLFVPINTLAYAFLPPHNNNAASGLINLSRNIGGSVGIAFATTLLARHAQLHQTFLVEHVSVFDPRARIALGTLRGLLAEQGVAAVQTTHLGLAMLYDLVQQQAAMLSYVGIFRIMAGIFFAIAPLVAIMKRIRSATVTVGH
ncbi:MAG TPA: DHA2 family efflux MFS transporter permease subunit, partial [Tepidisphaeraceae bacterium]|nr:DHA2 family efflux MFS transporter permease subunit [Tepidisphaeraceae bacterium]